MLHLADLTYAQSISGYVNTILLGVIGAGCGYVFRNQGRDLRKIGDNLDAMEQRQSKSEQNIAILLDRDLRRHGPEDRSRQT